MGNRIAGCGESASTRRKEEFFGLCLAYHMGRENRFLQTLRVPRPYFHLDLNAGQGFNAQSRTVGTPILFLRQATKFARLSIHATFVDKNAVHLARLRQRVGAQFSEVTQHSLFGVDRNYSFKRGDNEHEIATFSTTIVPSFDAPQFARGSIISDPNGWSRRGGSVSLEAFAAAAAALPQFLLLVFFPYALGKMVRGWVEADAMRIATVRRVQDYLPLRPYWLLSEPRDGKIYLCGSAQRMPEGTVHVPAWHSDSQKGRAIIDACDTIVDRTKAQRRHAGDCASVG